MKCTPAGHLALAISLGLFALAQWLPLASAACAASAPVRPATRMSDSPPNNVLRNTTNLHNRHATAPDRDLPESNYAIPISVGPPRHLERAYNRPLRSESRKMGAAGR